jgi:formylglycine-generating enzyme required for sulfatase activity
MLGLSPMYYSDASFINVIKASSDSAQPIDLTPGSYDNPFVNWIGNGYRLPTEGEWQYAASYIDGFSWSPYDYLSGANNNYNIPSACLPVAWFDQNAGGYTQNVGGKMPNFIGICDMSGNVYEWCWDWDGNYPGTYSDYKGASHSAGNDYRIMRGGSFEHSSVALSIGYRYFGHPMSYYPYCGFRFVKNN